MNHTSQPQLNIQKLYKPPTAIVYSKDFEPISHIPMTNEMYNYFTQYDLVRFPVQSPITVESANISAVPNLYAEISAMKVFSNDGIRLILIAKDDETVLLMNNTFLPGQTKEVNYIKTQAFYLGMLRAIKEIKNK